MAKKMLIDATHAEETRVVVVDGNKVEEFDFESENKRQLAGNIYLAKVTRVEPSLQAAFVDYGGNRHGFLAFSEIHPDYYQIPVADREKLMEEERAYAEALKTREDEEEKKPRRSRRRSKPKAEETRSDDAVETREIDGMETIDLDVGGTQDNGADAPAGEDTLEGHSPMDLVADTPVEEPTEDAGEETDEDAGARTEQSDEDLSADEPDDQDADEDDENGVETDDDTGEAHAKDSTIESVADDDDHMDIRPPRKPRPRRYKIQEVIKVRQILLVQVVKEERGNKGAALTTYLSLAGRYCVLMPNTARGGGISRKIVNAADRKKLKEIANEIEVPQGAGLIVRTAGAKRTKTEIKRDYEYLQRLWEQIRELTLKSIAPAKIYEEGDLIKRSIRDLYSREIDEVLVEGERGYRIAKDFMKMIMPSHAKNVKLYAEQMPLFARYQVESYLGSMFNPTVQLKSGGYIVIGVTEALVAIDVNSGRATKEGSIEETALKTNLEAAEEVARQLRLRDLAGLIVIDFIDMDERRNNNAVEKRIKDKLKTDRARIQVGRISGFGLMEMSRQRLRPGMIEATTQPCPSCHGTGLIRSDDNLALQILRQMEEEGTRGRSREVLLKCPVGIANFLMNQKREHVAQIEARYGLSVRIEGDPMLISPDYTLEKFKTATRVVPEVTAPVVSVDTTLMDQIDAEDEAEEEVEETATQDEETPKPKKRRRRRSRRRKTNGEGEDQNGEQNGESDDAETTPSDTTDEVNAEAAASEAKAEETGETPASETPETPEASEEEQKPKRRSRSRKKADTTDEAKPEAEDAAEKPKRTTRSRKKKTDEATDAPADDAKAEDTADKPKRVTRTRKKAADTEAKPDAEKAGEKPKRAPRSRAKKAADAPAEAAVEAPVEVAEKAAEKAPEKAPEEAKVEVSSTPAPEKALEPAAEETVTADPVATAEPAVAEAAPAASEDKKPKRRGWWSLSKG
ncbi:Rne/Rng family ribonuclease [Rhodalgimonas zhirmunskyi]|uniref:Ribonuclease E n=1 Tax=Rhodalgimonas zhirmunskyi TaxID=2964767 RepID=A0AAJ1U7S5_9RHOB|nr:Rne/Rng family ribonuclease [Rhodoalgimonas zhirmunskyi]MDQ2092653.1 Rne/Rng family ribonuclease [Rhodoalgimonas zhirmunskyi]